MRHLINIAAIKINTLLLVTLVAVMLYSAGCKKDEEETVKPLFSETGTMTDVEGNAYNTVKIGNQWWMAENLKVTKYRNGNSIPHHNYDADWSDGSAAYTLWSDESNSTVNYPGLLYNWAAVTDTGNIAPVGWHIPTDNEWKELEMTIGMSAAQADNSGWRGTNEGEKLKAKNTQEWVQYSNVWATNESGFTARAGSCRLFDGNWGDPGLRFTGFWWSSSGRSSSEAWYRYLDYKNANVFRSACNKNYGFSIRCVKDN
jgi:uncharacterized protein (TIGR02145 family)